MNTFARSPSRPNTTAGVAAATANGVSRGGPRKAVAKSCKEGVSPEPSKEGAGEGGAVAKSCKEGVSPEPSKEGAVAGVQGKAYHGRFGASRTTTKLVWVVQTACSLIMITTVVVGGRGN